MLTCKETDKLTKKQTPLKTSASLRYATPVGKTVWRPGSAGRADGQCPSMLVRRVDAALVVAVFVKLRRRSKVTDCELCDEEASCGRWSTVSWWRSTTTCRRPALPRRHALPLHAAVSLGLRPMVAGLSPPRLVVDILSHTFGSRLSDHYFRSVCLSVCLFVCLCSFSQPSLIRFRSN